MMYLQLFVVFFKIGLFTFGGGWAMISIIQREVVDNHKWIGKEDFLDLLAMAQSLPGILAVNIATVIGNNIKGVKGSIAAALGTILPSFLIILFIAVYLTPDVIKENQIVAKIFKGIRPAVVALIIAPVLTTAKSAGINRYTILVPVVVALLIYSKIPVISSPIIYIVLGAVVGYVVYSHNLLNKKKGGAHD